MHKGKSICVHVCTVHLYIFSDKIPITITRAAFPASQPWNLDGGSCSCSPAAAWGYFIFLTIHIIPFCPAKPQANISLPRASRRKQCPLGTTLLIDGQRRLARAVHLRGAAVVLIVYLLHTFRWTMGEFNQNQGTQKRKESSGHSGLSE